MKMSYAIETSGLTKRFKQTKDLQEIFIHPFKRPKIITVIKDINIKIKKGEIFGLLGPNGVGKTTLIKLLCTLILPTEGTAFINGYNIVKDDRKVRENISLVTGEERSFYWRLTGKQNLEFFAALHNIPSQEARQKINELFEIVGLKEKADVILKNYSTGMRQKMAVIRALLNNSQVIFMDEATKSLDPLASQNLREFIQEKLIKEEGKTIVFATHRLEEAERLCDRIAIMNQGRIKICGTVEEIKRKETSLEEAFIEITKGRTAAD